MLMERKRNLVGLIAWIILCYGAMWVGAHPSPGEWYARLIKPTFTPAGWIIGLVWFVLYSTMGIAAWRATVCRPVASRGAVALPLTATNDDDKSAGFLLIDRSLWLSCYLVIVQSCFNE